MSAYQASYLVERFGLSLHQANAFVSTYGLERNELIRKVEQALADHPKEP